MVRVRPNPENDNYLEGEEGSITAVDGREFTVLLGKRYVEVCFAASELEAL